MIFGVISTTISDKIPMDEDVSIDVVSGMAKEIQQFKLPISYLAKDDLYTLHETVANDLELTTTTENTKCMYEFLFRPTHPFAKYLIPEWQKQYTTNVDYLNDTRDIIQGLGASIDASGGETFNCNILSEVWNTVKNDTYFLDKYSYMDWDFLKYLNRSPLFLQFVTFMSITSPIISLLVPIILLIFPFLLLKIQQIPISFTTYLETLKHIAKNHFIGKTLFNMQTLSWDKVVYVLFSLGLYLLQIYNNIKSCLRFYKNMSKINNVLIEMRRFTDYSTKNMRTFMEVASDATTYKPFLVEVKKHCDTLEKIKEELRTIGDFNVSLQKLGENGYMMKCFYELYDNQEYGNSIKFAMGFEAYMNNLLGVHDNLTRGVVSFANLGNTVDGSGGVIFNKQYYPPLIDENPTKNNCNLEKNIIISAPNKAGKTTVLKTTTINIIFTQQIGCGFYQDCRMTPYTHIHSYLNIPDTSGRDSLFQAESRRCKDILDIIHENNDVKKYRHFCIFDELYSGTNPEEACKAGTAFLTYLSKFSNVDFMLTTHYLSICKKFRKSENIQNYKMEVHVLPDGNFEYTYKMKKGISRIKGAIRVLKDMNYPEEIIRGIEGVSAST